MRNSRFVRSTLFTLALTSAVASLALDVNSTAFARGTAGASGAAGAAGGSTGGGSTGSGGGANPIRDLSVVTIDQPPQRYHHYVPMRSRTSDTCWKATMIYDGAGNSLGAIPRQECYAQ